MTVTPPNGFVSINREAIYAALFALVSSQTTFAWKTVSRRLKLWGDVPEEQRPALFQYEGEDETYSWANNGFNPIITLRAKLFVYTSCEEPNLIGATELNQIMDALHGALMPTAGPMLMQGRQNLGGLVQSCRISGNVDRTPGDLDGDGMLMVPIEIVANR